jgi:LysM repeat protein
MVREAIVLTDELTKERFEFPINPETISVTQGRTFTEIPVIGLDSVMGAGNLAPVVLSWDGYFPAVYDATLCNYVPERPDLSVRRIEKWLGKVGTGQGKPVPLRAVVTSTYFSRLMVLTEFETQFRGGEPGDVYYTISLQSWRQQTIRIETLTSATPPKASTPRPPKGTAPKTHKVVRGDTLTLIAKKYYGDGSKWRTIYDANKKVIGSNPNLIKPGQVLVIP